MRQFRIGYRTLKTAVGSSISMLIAMFLELDYFSSAFILTVLCIQPTRHKSFRAVFARVAASSVGLFFAFIFFELFDYHPIVFGIMLLVYIPTLVSLRIQDGFVSSIVIILHVFDQGGITPSFLWNEVQLMAVGFGIALLVNMYMPDIERQLTAYRHDLEACYATIFCEIANYLRDGDSAWSGKELVTAGDIIEKGKALAYQDVQNHLTRKENLHYLYFDMRERQYEIIERILPKITSLPKLTRHAEIIADFTEELGEHVHSGNTASVFIQKLEEVKQDFHSMELPKDRKQFESMAAMFQFIEEMEDYLKIKKEFIGFKTKKNA
ncbi:aromatic acid exporter family protein [Paenisporosarcina cavernae]|uniref:Aromatic acid exporter family protein n=1 Tax=Paenisporosarcina cavernae TaxID=2320858 RepID=A0A385YUZ7_9BACL|nr:aromatic acid exporter family protein [Paenisporosarcina cavernae]AYC29518.1 aromatic acid exporter family protein [Paenisporosarcina cavernae]